MNQYVNGLHFLFNGSAGGWDPEVAEEKKTACVCVCSTEGAAELKATEGIAKKRKRNEIGWNEEEGMRVRIWKETGAEKEMKETLRGD